MTWHFGCFDMQDHSIFQTLWHLAWRLSVYHYLKTLSLFDPPYILDLMTPWLITPCLMPPVLLILCTFYLMLDASCLWSHFSFFAITTSALVVFTSGTFLVFWQWFHKVLFESFFCFFLWHFRSSPQFPKSRLWRQVMPLQLVKSPSFNFQTSAVHKYWHNSGEQMARATSSILRYHQNAS